MLIVKKRTSRIVLIFIMAFLVPLFGDQVLAKYVMEEVLLAAQIQIARTKPEIQLIDVTNSNTNYPQYASKRHTITIRVKVIRSPTEI